MWAQPTICIPVHRYGISVHRYGIPVHRYGIPVHRYGIPVHRYGNLCYGSQIKRPTRQFKLFNSVKDQWRRLAAASWFETCGIWVESWALHTFPHWYNMAKFSKRISPNLNRDFCFCQVVFCLRFAQPFHADPFRLLVMYLRDKGYRLLDLFAQFDVNKDWSISRAEFLKGLKVSHFEDFVMRLLGQEPNICELTN